MFASASVCAGELSFDDEFCGCNEENYIQICRGDGSKKTSLLDRTLNENRQTADKII
jgi:hypothetical protein